MPRIGHPSMDGEGTAKGQDRFWQWYQEIVKAGQDVPVRVETTDECRDGYAIVNEANSEAVANRRMCYSIPDPPVVDIGVGDLLYVGRGRSPHGRHYRGFAYNNRDDVRYPRLKADHIRSPAEEMELQCGDASFTVKTTDAEWTDGVDTYRMSDIVAAYIDQSGGTGDTYGALSGAVNGSNKVFTVSQGEYTSGSLRVWLNGQLQTQGSGEDWTETTPGSGTFTFATAPETGDEITAIYSVIGGVAAPPAATHIQTVTAGEAISQCDRVYLNPSDNEWYQVDSDATSTVKCGSQRGVANTAAAGNGYDFEVVLWGPVSNFSGLTPGAPLWASTTAGSYTQTKPDPEDGGGQLVVDRIGVALSATKVWVEPSAAVYMERETLANNATMTIEHHADDVPHSRTLRVYAVEAAVTGLDSSNKDLEYDIDGSPSKLAQSFQLSNAAEVRKARLYLKKTGLSGETVTVRIETDSGGDPSGTLADADATASMSADDIGAGLADMDFVFPDSFSLAGSTTFWLVLTVTNPDGSNELTWGAEGSGGAGSYASGVGKQYTGVWSEVDRDLNGTDDFCFGILTDRLDPCVVGRWGGGTRDIAARFDDESNANKEINTTIKNVTGSEMEVLVMVEVQ